MSDLESKGSHDVSLIMDDLQSYYERPPVHAVQDGAGRDAQAGRDRRPEAAWRRHQEGEWRVDGPVRILVRHARPLGRGPGRSHFGSGKCPGCKSKGSLPPSIVLEVLQILEAEVNLREETRVTQQARGGPVRRGLRQAGPQAGRRPEGVARPGREAVNERIQEIPDSEQDFAYEMGLLAKVDQVMGEAEGDPRHARNRQPRDGRRDRGDRTPAQDPRGSTRRAAAEAAVPHQEAEEAGPRPIRRSHLLGTGVNQKEVREDHAISQSTGETGPTLPEEFRAGLDEYFNRLERRPAGK